MSKTISATRALKAEILWFQAQEILVWLALGYMPEFARPTQAFSGSKIVKDPSAMPTPVGWVEIDKEGLARLQTTLNTIFKMMAKVLPDLKAVELNDITEGTRATSDPVALARQVRGMLALEEASRVAPGSERVQ
jgi:hypothetical protein